MKKNDKLRNFILPLCMVIVATAALLFLVKDRTSTLDFQYVFQRLINNLDFAFIAFLLLFPNWLIETIKWKSLVQRYISMSFLRSIKSILAGIGLSIFTPNRIGDLGGRILYIEKAERLIGFYMTFLCSCSQLFVTIVIGSAGFLFFMDDILGPITYNDLTYTSVIVVDLVLLVLFLYIEKFRKLYRYLIPKMRERIDDFPVVSIKQKCQLIIWSFIRYQIFALQFYYLMMVFDSDITLAQSYFALSVTYLFSSFMPTSVISEVPVRGSIAFIIFTLLNLQADLAAICFVLMWIVNLLIPAAFSLFLLKDLRFSSKERIKLA